MTQNINKYIDINQFIKNKSGSISWKKSIGISVEFIYYGEKHILKLLDNDKDAKKDYVKVKIDDMNPQYVSIKNIKNLDFDKLLNIRKYFYNIGDIVGGVEIIEQCTLPKKSKKVEKGFVYVKSYKCKCLQDNYEYVIAEDELKRGRGCPVCANRCIVAGINDIGTTNPEVVRYLLNKEDANLYSKGSKKYVSVKCPICGNIKKMSVAFLVKNGGISCEICSDGISYPNKFAHELFKQLSNQYQNYIPEYSPHWANRYIFDNYVELSDDRKIVVEMDGGLHFRHNKKFGATKDKEKDKLANENGVLVYRINCDYIGVSNRYFHIKNNIVNELCEIFDLSNIDWDACNLAGTSNKMIDIITYYNENPNLSLTEIANTFFVSGTTVRNYLRAGEKIGLCEYIRFDSNRKNVS